MKLDRSDISNRNITRMNHAKVKGFWVRVVKDGKMHQQLFSDNQYGGEERALEEARRHRDHLRQRLHGTNAASMRRVCTSFKGNSTGVVGVHYTEKERSGRLVSAYVASWCPIKGGPQRHKYFSVSKLGKEEAFRQAVAFRQARVEEILLQERNHPIPCL